MQNRYWLNLGTDKLSKVKLGENYSTAERNTKNMFKVIRSNTEIAITLPRIARLRSSLVQFHHITAGDTLQMFKVKGQRSRSQRKVGLMYQQRKRYNTAVDRFSDFKVCMAT